MKVYFVPSGDNLQITLLEKPEKKDVLDYKSITWRWDIFASERGEHPLYLNVTGYVYSSLEGGRFRTFNQAPPLFDDYITVEATRWEVFTDFVASRWPVFVPIFLTILTVIIIPLVVFWWKRRNQPSAPRDSSREPDDQSWI